MIRQGGHCLDLLGRRQQPRWPRPPPLPGFAGVRRHGRNSAHRALGRLGGDWRSSVEAALTDAVDEGVDEIGDVRRSVIDHCGQGLLFCERLGQCRGEAEGFDAEAGLDRLDLVGQEPREALHVAHRHGDPDTDRLHAIVDPATNEIEALGPQSLGPQSGAELDDQLADMAGDGLCRADGLREIALHLDQLVGSDRLDRLAENPEGLIDAATELRPEAQSKRRARLREEVADPLEAENMERRDHVGRQAKRGEWKARQHGTVLAERRDQHGPRGVASQGVRRAPAVGDRRTRAHAGRCKPVDQAGEHGLFAAVKVVGACGVDHQAVRGSAATIGA